ncbi:hypothetical protein D6D13_09929 [Aureobasidium pullulans]|uniref:Nephrocystin 3-like N-terminal domain-containing protein n=1 Tax=Aureobasidium pullulans TaxID=5580 RepID=A0A4S9C0T0_AURPU|nr:hypothetical protein D6D13_09929 [Aureobasidium pullulans]
MAERSNHKREDYTVAWICPLEIEQIAALEMLEKEHPRLPQPANDHNVYNLGSINGHNVVVAGLHTTGNCSAATVVAQMRGTFPQLRFGLLVGIGGGVPVNTDAGPIRLGHIVVSKPVGQHSGAVQYDHGKAEAGTFIRTGFLAPPPNVLLNAARESEVRRRRLSEDPLVAHLRRIDVSKRGLRNYNRPSSDQDHLYEPSYVHVDREKSCKKCGCEAGKRVDRSTDDSDDENIYEEDDNWLTVHRGTIASGELVMRDGRQRDTLAQNDKVLCFEMEAAGALNNFPCLVVRGISDYSDSHKNDKWHGYAAAVAAAYARELFFHMPVDEVKQCRISEADVIEMVQNTKKSARAADHTEDLRIRDWLRPADASINYVTASGLCHPGTGAWFLKSPVYKKFLQAPDGRLWLRGIPGSGKTVLASTIIKELRCADEEPESAIIYFFFAFSDSSKQKLEHLLRSLIFQLSDLHKSGRARLTSRFEKYNDGHEQPSTKDLVELLEHMNESLDDDIKAYVHHRLETERNLSRWKSMHNSISDTLVEKAGGMFRWVYCQLEELSGCLDKPAVRLMLETLPLDLNHTYDRILENIPRARVPNAIKLLQFLAFSNRPLSLRALVDAIATNPNSRIPFDIEGRVAPPDAIIGYCSSLVKLTYYRRPGFASVYVSACSNASSVRPAPKSDTGSGLDLGADAGSETEYGYEPQLELAHFSVKEYLLLHRNETPYQENFQIAVANAMIASTCLAYLWTLKKYLRKLVDAMGLARGERRTEFFLVEFATQNWLDHARVAGENQEQLFSWTSKVFVDMQFMTWWLKIYNVALEVSPEVCAWLDDDIPPSLYYASLGGLDRSVRVLLDRGTDIDAGSTMGRSALQIAAHEGHVELVKDLIRRGANVNARNRHCSTKNSEPHTTALTAASNNGHVRTVQILLEHGSDINAGPRTTVPHKFFSGSALRAASANGHLKVVQLLLDRGADVNIDRHGFALHAALFGAHREVLLLLLKRGADICAHDDLYGTALRAAVLGGDLTIVKLLLKRGAYSNEWGLQGAVEATVSADRFDMLETLLLHYTELDREVGVLNRALMHVQSHTDRRIVRILLQKGAGMLHFRNNSIVEACRKGDVAIVKLFLDCGIRFDHGTYLWDKTDERECDPLLVACQNSQFEIVKLLVASGAKLSHNNLYRESTLKHACAIGHYEIVKWLLENGVDVNKTCDYLDLPLESACRNGSLEVIRMLLEYGAKVDAGDSGALKAASGSGHIGVAQLLLAQGANVNGRRKSGTPIQAACSGGHLKLVELLLVNGADPNAAGGNSGNALSNACLSGNIALVSLLLDRGVHPNIRDKQYGSALQRLCSYAVDTDLEMVQLLLDRGADVDARGGKFGTALCEAASQDKLKMVRMLLERGADPNLRDKRFGSALQAACGERHSTSPDLVQLLLDNGADVNARGGEYGNALCAAAVTSSTEVAQILLARGAYINSWGGRHGDALRLAFHNRRKDMVKTLVKWGWILMIRIRPVWKRRCNMSRSQPRTRFQKRDCTSSGSVSSGGSWSIKSWVSTDSCDVRNSGSESD